MKKIRCTLLCLPLMLAVFAVTGCGEDKKETTTSFPQESTAPESHGMTQTAAPDGAGSQPAEDTTPDESMSGETMPEGTVGGTDTGGALGDDLDEMGDDISRAADDLMDDLTEGTNGTDNR